jgi:hypothetical protein
MRGWITFKVNVNHTRCKDLFFFFLFFENIQMSHHSGTTTCRSANIWYTSHNMYLIYRVTSMQQNIYNIIRIAESTSININVNHKRAIHKSICLRLLKHNTLITYQKTSSTKYKCHVGH